MTLPTSGVLSLSDIQTEFGGSNPISLSEYYAGGTYVPAGTTGTNGAVPSTGAISLTNFYGTSSVVVNFTDASVTSSSFSGASAAYEIYGSGTKIGKAYGNDNGNETLIEQWITPTSAATDYEVYTTFTGYAPTGTVNAWVGCSTSPIWSIGVYSGTVASYLTLQVRRVGTTTVLDTWTVSLYADSQA